MLLRLVGRVLSKYRCCQKRNVYRI